MTCRKASDIDLAAFLVDPEDPTLAEFRAHYPGCADCAAEVRAWTELHSSLREDGQAAEASHPSEESLLAFEDRPDSLPPQERSAIEHHLARCASCRDELAALRSFDFPALAAPGRAPHSGWKEAVGRAAAWLRGLVLHPAFAYALVLLLLVPTIMRELPARRTVARFDAQPKMQQLGSPADEEAAELKEKGAVEPVPPTARKKERSFRHAQSPALEAAGKDKDAEGAGGTQLHAAPAPPAEGHLGRVSDGAAIDSSPAASDAIRSAPLARRAPAGGVPGPESRVTGRIAPELKPAAPSAQDLYAARRTDMAKQTASRSLSADSVTALSRGEEEAGPPTAQSPDRRAKALREQVAWAPLDLRAGVTSEVNAGDLGAGVTLRVPAAGPPNETAPLEIRVLSSDGRRELRERVPASGETGTVEMRVPAGWLTPGSYRVEVHSPGESENAPPLQTFAFVVR